MASKRSCLRTDLLGALKVMALVLPNLGLRPGATVEKSCSILRGIDLKDWATNGSKRQATAHGKRMNSSWKLDTHTVRKRFTPAAKQCHIPLWLGDASVDDDQP